MRKTILNGMTLAVALTLSGGAYAAMSKDDYQSAKDRIQADAKTNKASCKSMSGNAKDICMAEANGKEKVAKANLEAEYKPTNKAQKNARDAKADADYAVAKEKCDDMSGNAKDVCVKEARAARTAAKADATADRKVTEARKEGGARTNEKVSEARKDAAEDKREAEYKVAREKCDSLSGDAKDKCQADAKARYSKR